MTEQRPFGAVPPEPSNPYRAADEALRATLWAALERYGDASYLLVDRPHGQSIRCLVCGLESAHPTDREERYCGFCYRFHVEGRPRDPEQEAALVRAVRRKLRALLGSDDGDR
jgi:hypothetical protein